MGSQFTITSEDRLKAQKVFQSKYGTSVSDNSTTNYSTPEEKAAAVFRAKYGDSINNTNQTTDNQTANNNLLLNTVNQKKTFGENLRAAIADSGIGDRAAERRLSRLTEKYGTKVFDDTFVGQLKANYASGKLQQESSVAWSDYMDNPTQENLEYAQSMQSLYDKLVNNNDEALDDENVKAEWLTKTVANYLPQLGMQMKKGAAATLSGTATGAGIGAATAGSAATAVLPGIGTLTGAAAGAVTGGGIGFKVGATIGSGLYSYDTMRGTAFYNLVQNGADEVTAKTMANDEALISSIIEMGDTAIEMITLLPGMGKVAGVLSKAVTEEASKSAIKAFTKEAAKYAANIGQEFSEEFLQEILSIANERRLVNGNTDSGTSGLLEEAKAVIKDMASGKSEEELSRSLEAGKGGAIIGAVMGAGKMGVSHVTTNIQKTNINAKLDRMVNDEENLEGYSDDELRRIHNISQNLKNNTAVAYIQSEINKRNDFDNNSSQVLNSNEITDNIVLEQEPAKPEADNNKLRYYNQQYDYEKALDKVKENNRAILDRVTEEDVSNMDEMHLANLYRNAQKYGSQHAIDLFNKETQSRMENNASEEISTEERTPRQYSQEELNGLNANTMNEMSADELADALASAKTVKDRNAQRRILRAIAKIAVDNETGEITGDAEFDVNEKASRRTLLDQLSIEELKAIDSDIPNVIDEISSDDTISEEEKQSSIRELKDLTHLISSIVFERKDESTPNYNVRVSEELNNNSRTDNVDPIYDNIRNKTLSTNSFDAHNLITESTREIPSASMSSFVRKRDSRGTVTTPTKFLFLTSSKILDAINKNKEKAGIKFISKTENGDRIQYNNIDFDIDFYGRTYHISLKNPVYTLDRNGKETSSSINDGSILEINDSDENRVVYYDHKGRVPWLADKFYNGDAKTFEAISRIIAESVINASEITVDEYCRLTGVDLNSAVELFRTLSKSELQYGSEEYDNLETEFFDSEEDSFSNPSDSILFNKNEEEKTEYESLFEEKRKLEKALERYPDQSAYVRLNEVNRLLKQIDDFSKREDVDTSANKIIKDRQNTDEWKIAENNLSKASNNDLSERRKENKQNGRNTRFAQEDSRAARNETETERSRSNSDGNNDDTGVSGSSKRHFRLFGQSGTEEDYKENRRYKVKTDRIYRELDNEEEIGREVQIITDQSTGETHERIQIANGFLEENNSEIVEKDELPRGNKFSVSNKAVITPNGSRIVSSIDLPSRIQTQANRFSDILGIVYTFVSSNFRVFDSERNIKSRWQNGSADQYIDENGIFRTSCSVRITDPRTFKHETSHGILNLALENNFDSVYRSLYNLLGNKNPLGLVATSTNSVLSQKQYSDLYERISTVYRKRIDSLYRNKSLTDRIKSSSKNKNLSSSQLYDIVETFVVNNEIMARLISLQSVEGIEEFTIDQRDRFLGISKESKYNGFENILRLALEYRLSELEDDISYEEKINFISSNSKEILYLLSEELSEEDLEQLSSLSTDDYIEENESNASSIGDADFTLSYHSHLLNTEDGTDEVSEKYKNSIKNSSIQPKQLEDFIEEGTKSKAEIGPYKIYVGFGYVGHNKEQNNPEYSYEVFRNGVVVSYGRIPKGGYYDMLDDISSSIGAYENKELQGIIPYSKKSKKFFSDRAKESLIPLFKKNLEEGKYLLNPGDTFKIGNKNISPYGSYDIIVDEVKPIKRSGKEDLSVNYSVKFQGQDDIVATGNLRFNDIEPQWFIADTLHKIDLQLGERKFFDPSKESAKRNNLYESYIERYSPNMNDYLDEQDNPSSADNIIQHPYDEGSRLFADRRYLRQEDNARQRDIKTDEIPISQTMSEEEKQQAREESVYAQEQTNRENQEEADKAREAQARSDYGARYESIVRNTEKLKNIRTVFDERADSEEFKDDYNYKATKTKLDKMRDMLDKVSRNELSVGDFAKYYASLKDDKHLSIFYNAKVADAMSKCTEYYEKALEDKATSKNMYSKYSERAMALAEHSFRVTNKLIPKMEELLQNAEKHRFNLADKRFMRKVNNVLFRWQINPDNAFRLINGFDKNSKSFPNQIAKMVTDSTRAHQTVIAESQVQFSKVKKMKGYNEFQRGTDKGYTIGRRTLNQQQTVDLYKLVRTLLAENIGKDKHGAKNRFSTIEGFAIGKTLAEREFFTVDDLLDQYGITLDVKYPHLSMNDLAKAMLTDMENSMNDVSKAYLNASNDVLESLGKANAITEKKSTGIEPHVYGNGDYIQLRYAARNENTADTDVNVDFSFTKEREKYTGGYVLIENVSDVVDRYIDQSANHIAYSELGTVLQVLNQGNSLIKPISQIMKENFGSEFEKWMNNYIEDVTYFGVDKDPEGINKYLKAGRNMLQTGALIGSISVPLKQVSSFWAAMGILDPDILVKAYRPKFLKEKGTGADSPMEYYRTIEGPDPTVSESMNSKGIWNKLKSKSKLLALMEKGIPTMDYRAIDNLHYACMLQIEKNYPSIDRNSNEFSDKVEDLFADVVIKTQPIFTKNARAEYSRTDNEFVKLFSMFRTQQTQNFNRLITTIGEYKASQGTVGEITARTDLENTLKGQVASALSLSLLTIAADLLLHKKKKYKDDEDDENISVEKVLERIGINAVESAAGTFVFGDTIAKKIIDIISGGETNEYYGINMGIITTIENSIDSIERFVNTPTLSNARYAAGYISQAFGIPLNNAYSFLNSAIMYTADLAGVNDGEYDDVLKMLDKETIKASNSVAGNSNLLVENYLNGNEDKADKAYSFLSEDNKDVITMKAKSAYLEGEFDTETAENLLVKYTGITEEKAEKKVALWDFVKNNPEYEDVSESFVEKYETAAENAGIPINIFYNAITKYNDTKSIDYDGDGKTDVSRQQQMIEYINGLSLSAAQKDALWISYGYSTSTKAFKNRPWAK